MSVIGIESGVKRPPSRHVVPVFLVDGYKCCAVRRQKEFVEVGGEVVPGIDAPGNFIMRI